MADLFGNPELETPQSKGGKIRAQRLSKDERSLIARKAAIARWGQEDEQLVRATHGSPDRPLTIGNIEIPCYVLEDGRRVIVQRGIMTALDMKQGTAGRGGGDRLAKFASTKAIMPFVTSDLRKMVTEPIRFRASGSLAYGYEATVLADLCDAVLQAREAGELHYQQAHIAKRCEILVRAFARLGIIALVDEATGYQEVRDRKALEEILNKFISEELRRWTKTFPDDYFKEIFRLRGWSSPTQPGKRPGVLGHYTNDIVYERLAPGLLDELQRLNPSDGQGHRKHRHHQYLTDDHGDPRLREHLDKVTFLMKASSTWNQFKLLLDRAMPKINATGLLPLPDPE
jgi:P63C domain